MVNASSWNDLNILFCKHCPSCVQTEWTVKCCYGVYSVPQMLNLINTLDVLDLVVVHNLCGFFYDLCRTFGHTFTVTKVCGMSVCVRACVNTRVCTCVCTCVCFRAWCVCLCACMHACVWEFMCDILRRGHLFFVFNNRMYKSGV